MARIASLDSMASSKASPLPETSEDLLLQVARGDVAAYETLYSRVSGAVFGLVLRVLRDRAQSEEVAQEVMVLLWQQAPRFDESRGSAMAWMMTIAHRRAVDRVRAEVTASAHAALHARTQEGPSFDHVAEDVALGFERQAVRDCLQALTALQRQAVDLAYYGGHSYPEVAGILDIPLGTVKTRIRDGLLKLRDCLGVTDPG